MENTGPRGDRGIFFDHESYLSNITNKVAVIVPRRGSMEVNFQLCGNKTHFTMLHTPNRISPIASPSGNNDSNAEANNSKNVSGNIERQTIRGAYGLFLPM